MRLLIKQRVFSWSDTYDVYDEEGNVRYFVRAEVFALGHQIHVYDAAHVEVGMIRQKLFNLLPVFEIETGGIKRGQIEKQFTLFRPKYDIDFNGWRVEGDFLGWDYDVYSGCIINTIFNNHCRKSWSVYSFTSSMRNRNSFSNSCCT